MRLLVETPRTTREYETIFIIRPDALDDDRKKVIDRFEGIIGRLDGQILRKEEWGRRRLAYRIEKHAQGVYYFYNFMGYSDLVGELERNLRILEPVLKYLTIKIDEDVDREERVSRADTPKAKRDVYIELDDDDDDDDDDND